jgi:hypothetical protein
MIMQEMICANCGRHFAFMGSVEFLQQIQAISSSCPDCKCSTFRQRLSHPAKTEVLYRRGGVEVPELCPAS